MVVRAKDSVVGVMEVVPAVEDKALVSPDQAVAAARAASPRMFLRAYY